MFWTEMVVLTPFWLIIALSVVAYAILRNRISDRRYLIAAIVAVDALVLFLMLRALQE